MCKDCEQIKLKYSVLLNRARIEMSIARAGVVKASNAIKELEKHLGTTDVWRWSSAEELIEQVARQDKS
jgi:hypothetical protein